MSDEQPKTSLLEEIFPLEYLRDLKLEIFLGVPVRELNASEVETYYRVYKDRYPNDVRPRERLFTPFLEPFDTNATYIPAIAVPILDDASRDDLGDAFRTAGFPRALSDIVTTLEKFDRAIRGNKIILDFLKGINPDHQGRNLRPTMTSSFDIESLDFEGYAGILLEKEAAEKAALEKVVAAREATPKESTEETTTDKTTTMQTTMATDHLNDVDASLLSALALEDDHSIVSPSPAQPFGSTSRLLAFISAQLNLNNLSVQDHQAALIDLIDDYHRRIGLPSDNEGGEEHQQEEEEEVAEEAEEAEDDDEEEEDELDMPAVQGNLPTIHELMVEVNKRANSCKSLANNHLRQVESMLKEVQAINAASRANEALLAEATASANASEAAARAALAASYAAFPPEPASGSGAGSAAGAGPSSSAADASGSSKKKSKSKGKRKGKGKGKGRKK